MRLYVTGVPRCLASGYDSKGEVSFRGMSVGPLRGRAALTAQVVSVDQR